MKARVIATGEIGEFSQIDEITFKCAINGHLYCAEELEFLEPSVFTPDYWTRLEHIYAGMAMQALIIDASYAGNEGPKYLVEECTTIAHALVEKYKEKEEKK